MTDETHDQELCMDLAEPLLQDFHEIWHHAVNMYYRIPAEFTAEHDETTVANCIRSHAWTEVGRRFDGRPGFKLLRLRRLNLLLHCDKSVWRFKRVDGDGRHANYQTKQQMDFDDQLPLPGLPPAAMRLTSGYEPDAVGSVERIIVARPIGRFVRWAAQVNIIDGCASWTDITPSRLPGTERIHYRGRRQQ